MHPFFKKIFLLCYFFIFVSILRPYKSWGQQLTQAGQAYEKALKSKNRKRIGMAAIQLGNAYIEQKRNTSTAKKYFEEARKIADELNSTSLRADVFYGLGMVNYLRRLYNPAIIKFKRAQELYKQMYQKEGEAKAFYQGGMCYMKLRQQDKAIQPLKNAHNLAGKYKLYQISAGSSNQLSKIYTRKAENIRNQHEKNPDRQQRAQYKKLYDELKSQAHSYKGMHEAISRSLRDIKNNQYKVNKLLIEQEKQEKEMLIKQLEIEQQERQLLEHEDSLKRAQLKLQIVQETAEKRTAQTQRLWAVLAGVLALAFFAIYFLIRMRNAKKQIEKEKQKSEELLLNILPQEIGAELKSKGKATSRSYEHATILFTDFKGFTFMAEKLSPEELIEELNVCFSAFDDISKAHNLEKIKTIGDAYMCAGGIPMPNETHFTDAVKAGIEMQKFIEQRKEERSTQGLPYFELRLGINTGRIVAGVVGKSKFAYDIWGDAVNLASRMESSGEIGKVNISENTYRLVKDQFQCTHRGKIEAKNKGEVDMYFVENIIEYG